MVWKEVGIRFKMACYLGCELPPLDYVTSVRSIVFRGGQVLVMRNAHETHLIPGGRRESSETLEETLRREVLEETGWEITPLCVLGFVHFHHLTPKPQGYAYPYPNFLQVVYVAAATVQCPGARVPDEYEMESTFRPVTEARALDATSCQKVFLEAAIAVLTAC